MQKAIKKLLLRSSRMDICVRLLWKQILQLSTFLEKFPEICGQISLDNVDKSPSMLWIDVHRGRPTVGDKTN